jgi:hypothetical protein
LAQSTGVTLLKVELQGIVTARRLSQATMGNIWQNLVFAFIYNAIGVPIAARVLYLVFGLLLSRSSSPPRWRCRWSASSATRCALRNVRLGSGALVERRSSPRKSQGHTNRTRQLANAVVAVPPTLGSLQKRLLVAIGKASQAGRTYTAVPTSRSTAPAATPAAATPAETAKGVGQEATVSACKGIVGLTAIGEAEQER